MKSALKTKTRIIALTVFSFIILAGSCKDNSKEGVSVSGQALPLLEEYSEDTKYECLESEVRGCARIVKEGAFYAGEKTEFLIEYTVGSDGIPVGGGISAGMHHAAQWNTQISSMDDLNYVAIRTDSPANLTLDRIYRAPAGMFINTIPGLRNDAIFHEVLVATVKNRALLPGETVQFHFGAGVKGVVVPPFTDPHHEFRITTDTSSQGLFRAIKQSPVFPILHNTQHELAAFIPSQAIVGQTIDVNIRVEDRHHNIVETWYGAVDVFDENGLTVASKVPVTSGTGFTQVSLSAGYHRLRLASSSESLNGRSNPVKVTIEPPEEKLFWADLHGHTSISDGLGLSADEYFKYGRDSSHLDVVALTDHGHFDWPSTMHAVQKFYSPGDYVTILAQEAGAGHDHMNIYYRRDNQEHLSKWTADYREFLENVNSQFNQREKEAITAPHHFSYDRGFVGDPEYPFGAWDDRVARFVEVYSSHGTSEYPGNPRPILQASSDERKYMQHALSEGLRFGVIAASDNHDSHPGRSVWGDYAGGLAGIWASELTRESIWLSLYNYKSYGTSLDRIYVEFSINGYTMGSDIVNNTPVEIVAYVVGKTDTMKVELLKNNEIIRTQNTTSGLIQMQLTDTPDIGSNHYYIRATQDNGERAWSTPIWVTKKY